MKAANVYNKAKPKNSAPDQQKTQLARPKVVTNHGEGDTSPKYKPVPDQDHKSFQFGTNPMYEDGFEQRLVSQEKLERSLARERYVEGIQGRDGGKKPYECYNINN